jgi:hypothetical protein
MRMYKTGSRFALWRWSWAPDKFIVRLHLVMTPWFAICLHWINHADAEPHLHDHPVTFLSLVLRGGYVEWRQRAEDGAKWHHVKWFNWIRASKLDRHRIFYAAPHTLTLAFMSGKKRDWGYHTPEGWVYWRDYQKAQKQGVQNEESNPAFVPSGLRSLGYSSDGDDAGGRLERDANHHA